VVAHPESYTVSSLLRLSNKNVCCAILLANKTKEDTKRLGICGSEGGESGFSSRESEALR
jgi:hypothetical protein